MVLEIDYFREVYPTTNTAVFKNSKNPKIPAPASIDNINAPPNSFYNNICNRKIKVHDLIKFNFYKIFFSSSNLLIFKQFISLSFLPIRIAFIPTPVAPFISVSISSPIIIHCSSFLSPMAF